MLAGRGSEREREGRQGFKVLNVRLGCLWTEWRAQAQKILEAPLLDSLVSKDWRESHVKKWTRDEVCCVVWRVWGVVFG